MIKEVSVDFFLTFKACFFQLLKYLTLQVILIYLILRVLYLLAFFKTYDFKNTLNLFLSPIIYHIELRLFILFKALFL
jgi:hypothetical protein